ncbi:ABC transporter [Phytophthora megakarya]|uniref:ABC transporter n=1 Tax=Phytophthora megakarya TaxID=4795 RepID=A0A225UQC7_9STRA|nr:ABC transporter [Phytophthora megakarya]
MGDSEPESQVPPEGVWICAPVTAEWLKDWNEFRPYLDKYQEHTYQIFRQRTSTSVEKRNAEIVAIYNRSVQAHSSGAQDVLDEACLHAWLESKSSGKDFRKFHFDRDTGCKANIKVAVAWDNAKGIIMVRVTDYDVRHNHAVSKAAYQNHVSNRQVQDPTLLAFVDELQAAGANPKLMMQYLRKKTGKTLRYVHNLVSQLREKRKGDATTEERLEGVLWVLCESRGNRATVFVDEAKTAQTITMQTRQMRRWFKAFPEVLMIDATHNTNESRYELFSFMVNDVYGHVRDGF